MFISFPLAFWLWEFFSACTCNCFFLPTCVNARMCVVLHSYKELLDAKSQLEEREREMKMEREEMEAEAQSRLEQEREVARLKEDSER